MFNYFVVLVFSSYVVAQGVPDPRCPSSARPVVRLPHETDCSRFYICQFGLRHLMPACPRGLLFDSKSTACIHSSLVNCNRDTTINVPTITTKLMSSTSKTTFQSLPTVPEVSRIQISNPTSSK